MGSPHPRVGELSVSGRPPVQSLLDAGSVGSQFPKVKEKCHLWVFSPLHRNFKDISQFKLV